MSEQLVASDDETLVRSALKSVVQHYNQPIHNEIEEKAPYFDVLLGYPPCVPGVVQIWIDRLIKEPTIEVFSWITGYASFVRPMFIKSLDGSVALIQQYELILSIWLRHVMADFEENRNTLEFQSDKITELFQTIELIASDITLASASDEIIKFPSNFIRSNIILPTLWRLIHHCLSIIEISNKERGINDQNSALTRCVVSLLAFDNFHINPASVASFISESVDISSICSYLPTCHSERIQINEIAKKCLSFDLIDWSSVGFDSKLWNDPVTGVTNRTTYSVWQQIASYLNLLDHNENSLGFSNSRHDSHTDLERRRVRQSVILSEALGIPRMALAVRSHFFGRDLVQWEPDTYVTTRVIMGRSVTKSEPVLKEKAYKLIPSRIHVIVGFISVLEPGHLESESSREVLTQLLPVCYELLDSSTSNHVAMGVACLVHLLEVSNSHPDVWNEFAENALCIVNMALEVCRDGPVLVLLGKAHCLLFEVMTECSPERRRATAKWLSILDTATNRPSSDMICWELLVGGVIPLLYEHARLPNADSMELGRLGLRSLLTLVQGELVDSKTQVASIVALINLLVGAYLIMHRHGGKIMCVLVATAGDNVLQNLDQLALVKHAASVALAICGPIRAGKVVDEILSTEGFQPCLRQVVQDAKNAAYQLLEQVA